MYATFNINRNVKVKLTDRGLAILKYQHDDLSERMGKQREFTPPKVDENGFAEFQLWTLMETFGPYIRLAGELPFETEIMINGKDLEEQGAETVG